MSDRLVTRPWLTKNFAGGSLATVASRSARARGLVEQGRRFASRGVTTGRMVDEREGGARVASAPSSSSREGVHDPVAHGHRLHADVGDRDRLPEHATEDGP